MNKIISFSIAIYLSTPVFAFASRRQLIANWPTENEAREAFSEEYTGYKFLPSQGDYWLSEMPDGGPPWIYVLRNKVIVDVAGSTNKTGGMFDYSYAVNVSPGSPQELETFGLDLRAGFVDLQSPSNLKWRKALRYEFKPYETTWEWLFDQPTIGKTFSYFIVKSTSLPGIIPCFVEGAQPVYRAHSFKPFREGAQGRTIGPVLRPDVADRAAFLGSVSQDVETANQEGWIEDAAFFQEVKGVLSNTISLYGSGDQNAAKAALQTLLQRVQQKYESQQLLSEAYGILFYNLQFFLDQQ